MAEFGLYFIRGLDGLCIERCQEGAYTPLEWIVMGSEVTAQEPDGDIVAGPYTAEQLMQGVVQQGGPDG